MGLIDVFNHLLNFLMPAAWMAALVPLSARLVSKKRPASLTLTVQVAINFAVTAMVLVLGLLVFGRDGKMGTYTAMALLCATSQWYMLRGWRA